MYQFFIPSKDSTIYSQQSNQNTGLDEIIEISKTYILGTKSISRGLIQFDIDNISSSISSNEITMSSAELLLKECQADEVPLNYTIHADPVSGSWDMGIGTRFDEISTNSVTWKHRATGTKWLSTSASISNDSTASSIDGYGGIWYTSYGSTKQIEYLGYDVTMNVLDTMNGWLINNIPNNGFIIRFPQSAEDDDNDYGSLQFFSKETHTIYQPKLRIGWDDSSFNTGSLSELLSDNIKVTFKHLKSIYTEGNIVTIYIHGRDKYPLKSYSSQYSYNDIKYLPSTTYYQIRDALTNEIIIPFSDFSKVSCNENGNFFKLNLKNWETNRDYFIEIKTIRDGMTEYFGDNNIYFTVKKQ